MTAKKLRVIFDTNIWISFLIGKRLSIIEKYISNGQIILIVTERLLKEIEEVTGREKMRKYFPEESVLKLFALLKNIAEKFEITPTYFINRDPKDNFLLDLIDISKADYLVTGDKDLLIHNPFKTANIITPADFEKIITDS
jgi:putative PIN family toxin of toxin-antitoxin system